MSDQTKLNIKPATEEDFKTVRDITIQTISKIYPHYYPGGVVDFFLNHHSDSSIRDDIVSDKTYLALCGGECVGTVTINGPEICRLFILPEHLKKGYGTALMDFAEQKIFDRYCEAELHASLSGKKMYIERGYTEKEYRCKELQNGDWICIDIMKKER